MRSRSSPDSRGGDADAGAQVQALALEHDRARRAPRTAAPRAASGSRAPSASTANSSPPSRATVSAARSALRSRSPQISSRRSPAAWPSESLTCLKSSRSRNATTAASPAASASAIRFSSSARFGSPVRESVNASACSSSSRRRRRPARSSSASSAVSPNTADDARRRCRSRRSGPCAAASSWLRLGGLEQPDARMRSKSTARRPPWRARSRAPASARTPRRSADGRFEAPRICSRRGASATSARVRSIFSISAVISACTPSGRAAPRSPRTRARRSGWRGLELDELLVAPSPLVGAQVQAGDPDTRRQRDERDNTRDQNVRLPCIPRGGRREPPALPLHAPSSPW